MEHRAAAPSLSFWRLQLAGWGAFGVAMALSRVGRFPLAYMIATKGAMALIGLFYTSILLRPVYQRLLRGDPPLRRVIVVTVTASYAAAVFWTGTHSVADLFIERALLNPGAHFNNFWSVFGGTLYDAFALLAWSVMYVGIKHQQALHAERERSLRAEALAHEARLEALRWQLNPHFLFNALNAISTLVLDDRRQDAAKMISRLGDLLRSTLELPGNAEVPLAQELELAQRYLDIEQVRFGDRLSLRIDVDASARGAKVPSLLLQPLVENAIRHAVAPRESGGRIVVSAARVGDRLELTVEDDGPEAVPDSVSNGNGKGIGLANTRERLWHLYGDRQSMTLDRSGSLGGFRVRIALPYHE